MNDPKQLAQRYTPKGDKPLNLDRQVCVIRYSPCGKVLAAGGSDATVRRWDVSGAAPAPMANLIGHNGWVQGLAFAGKMLYTADSWGELRCTPYLDKEPAPVWKVAQAHDGWVRSLAVSADGKTLATGGMDRKVRLWAADKGTKLKEFADHSEELLAVAIHPDGKSVVGGDLKGNIKHFDAVSGKCVRTIDASVLYLLSRLQDVGGVRWLAFNPEGTTLAVAGGKPANGATVQAVPHVLFVDWTTSKLQHTTTIGAQNDCYVHEVHWHAAGFVMGVTSGVPGSGKFFFCRPGDAQPFFVTPAMQNCHSLAVHPDGKRLLVSATNGGSNGNGRLLKGNEYPGNFSPLYPWTLPV